MTERLAVPVARVREEPSGDTPYPLFRHAGWERRFPGLRIGITAASPEADFGLSRAPSRRELSARYGRLGRQLGFPAQAVPWQVHGAAVRTVPDSHRAGLWLAGEADGLVSARAGVLCCSTAADCVPAYLVDPARRVLGLVHAGWRGTAAGVLEAGLETMGRAFGCPTGSLVLHLGPAICGPCYEVGPEVPRALGLVSTPTAGEPDAGTGSTTVDLRAELVRRALQCGVPVELISVSDWCTRCDSDRFHSHRGRGAAAGRMAAFIGWLDASTTVGESVDSAGWDRSIDRSEEVAEG